MKNGVLTQEKFDELLKCIEENQKAPGPLQKSIHDAQRIFGYVPVEAQKIIAEKLNVSVAKINGVVTFYTKFNSKPLGENIIGVCLGTTCYVKGSKDILDKISDELNIGLHETTKDNKFSIVEERCIGLCAKAPAIVINETDYYHDLTVDQIPDILEKYR